MTKSVLVWLFLAPSEPQASPITAKTDADEKHHSIYLTTLMKFDMIFVIVFLGIRYSKYGQNLLLISLFKENSFHLFANSCDQIK